MVTRKTELELRLIDGISGPARAALADLKHLRHAITAMPTSWGKGAAQRAVETPMMPLAAALGPKGAVGMNAVRNFDALGRTITGRAGIHAAAAAGAYTDMSLSALAAVRAIAPIGLAAGLGAGVRQAADFESSLTEIQKKAGTSADETRRLGEEIKALATSGEVAVSIDDIAAAYARGAAAGLPLDHLREFARLSVKASDAFGMTAEEAGNFSAKLKTSLAMTDDQVRRVFDLTNSLADAGIADEKDIVAFQDRVGATTKVLGLSTEQGLALGATFLNLGFQAEVAATGTGALAGKLLTVGTLTGKAKKSFERVLGPTADFSKLVDEDANGALLKMLDTLKALPKSARMDFLKNFVGAEWSDEIIRLVEGVDELRRNLKLAGEEAKWLGSLDKSYSLKLDDLLSQWALVKNEVSKLAIDIGTAGLPALVVGLQSAVALVERIDAGFQQMRLRLDWTAIGEAKTAVGELTDELVAALGMDTSGSSIDEFFRDLAVLVRDLSGVIGAISRELTDIAKFAQDPWGEITRPRTDDELRAHGITPIGPEERERLGHGQRQRVEDTAAERRDRSASDFLRGDGLVSPEPAIPAERGGRVVQPDPARFNPKGFNDVGGLRSSIDALAAALQARTAGAARAARGDLGKATGTIAIPTPRPDIAGPVAQEGEKAATIADAIGGRISAAFSITAMPIVDASSIIAAQGKVDALAGALRALPRLSAAAAASVPSGLSSAVGRGPPVVLAPNVATAIGAVPTRDLMGGKAAGGAVRRGMTYEINERGTETVTMGTNGYVTPNHRLGGGGGGDTHHHTWNITGGDPKTIAREVEQIFNRRVARSRQIGITG